MDFNSFGLLLLRVFFAGTLALRHGLPKLMDFSNKMYSFPDPIGIGSTTGLVLSIGAELFCSIFVILGLFTRFAVVPIIFTMAVAFFIVHSSDPFAKKELAALFLASFVVILITGPGKYSADGVLRGVR